MMIIRSLIGVLLLFSALSEGQQKKRPPSRIIHRPGKNPLRCFNENGVSRCEEIKNNEAVKKEKVDDPHDLEKGPLGGKLYKVGDSMMECFPNGQCFGVAEVTTPEPTPEPPAGIFYRRGNNIMECFPNGECTVIDIVDPANEEYDSGDYDSDGNDGGGLGGGGSDGGGAGGANGGGAGGIGGANGGGAGGVGGSNGPFGAGGPNGGGAGGMGGVNGGGMGGANGGGGMGGGNGGGMGGGNEGGGMGGGNGGGGMGGGNGGGVGGGNGGGMGGGNGGGMGGGNGGGGMGGANGGGVGGANGGGMGGANGGGMGGANGPFGAGGPNGGGANGPFGAGGSNGGGAGGVGGPNGADVWNANEDHGGSVGGKAVCEFKNSAHVQGGIILLEEKTNDRMQVIGKLRGLREGVFVLTFHSEGDVDSPGCRGVGPYHRPANVTGSHLQRKKRQIELFRLGEKYMENSYHTCMQHVESCKQKKLTQPVCEFYMTKCMPILKCKSCKDRANMAETYDTIGDLEDSGHFRFKSGVPRNSLTIYADENGDSNFKEEEREQSLLGPDSVIGRSIVLSALPKDPMGDFRGIACCHIQEGGPTIII